MISPLYQAPFRITHNSLFDSFLLERSWTALRTAYGECPKDVAYVFFLQVPKKKNFDTLNCESRNPPLHGRKPISLYSKWIWPILVGILLPQFWSGHEFMDAIVMGPQSLIIYSVCSGWKVYLLDGCLTVLTWHPKIYWLGFDKWAFRLLTVNVQKKNFPFLNVKHQAFSLIDRSMGLIKPQFLVGLVWFPPHLYIMGLLRINYGVQSWVIGSYRFDWLVYSVVDQLT